MKLMSFNVNGLRSALAKGLKQYIIKEKPDIICLQEIKLPINYVDDQLKIMGYQYVINYSNKNGYSGVMCYYKEKPVQIIKLMGYDRFDQEGRLIILEYKNQIIINIYLPHGGRKKENLLYKLEVFNKLNDFLKRYQDKNINIIMLGDFNIAHNFNDVERAKQNVNNIMFTNEERNAISNLISNNLVDTFRLFNNHKGNYTWYPYAFHAKERNLGWRIDYAFVSVNIANMVIGSLINQTINCSDHCPIILEIKT